MLNDKFYFNTIDKRNKVNKIKQVVLKYLQSLRKWLEKISEICRNKTL